MLAAVLMVVLGVHFALGQGAPQEPKINDPHLSTGTLVTKGESKTPIGRDKLLTYKLEEVDLPQPLEFDIRGKQQRLNKALRLTISSESIQGAHTIWIDDAALPRVFGLGANAIGVLIYDRSILRNGAEISVSDGKEFVTLPEKLKLPKNFTATIEPIIEEGSSIIAIRSALRIVESIRQPLIEIEMKTDRAFPVRNAVLQLQIGKRFFQNELREGSGGHTLILDVPPSTFAELKDGAEVIAFYNTPDRSGASGREIWYFGRLNKSMLK
jgi:hypothetical protein